MTTNTTKNVGSTHVHQFGAQGKCGCGVTHDEWRAQHEANLAANQTPAEANDGGGGSGEANLNNEPATDTTAATGTEEAPEARPEGQPEA